MKRSLKPNYVDGHGGPGEACLSRNPESMLIGLRVPLDLRICR